MFFPKKKILSRPSRRSQILGLLLIPALALTVVLAVQFQVEAAERPDFRLMGWATAGHGTTGGEGGKTVTVTSPEALVHYMARPEPLIILVQGTIDMRQDFPGVRSNGRYDIASNKSILGLGADARIRGAELRMREVNNIIIRNLTVSESPDTAIAISTGTTHVWIDHCDIFGAPDGLIDITTGADFVTVSWNRLHNSARMGLCGRENDQSSDQGRTRVTYHNNWFNNLDMRVPHVAWGKIHIFNNYYTNVRNSIEVGVGSRVVSEHNYLDGVRRAHFVRWKDDLWDTHPGLLVDVGSIYTNIQETANHDIPDISMEWHPRNQYSYTKAKASSVPHLTRNNSGVGIIDPRENLPTSD